jgi:hypothetical protein
MAAAPLTLVRQASGCHYTVSRAEEVLEYSSK